MNRESLGERLDSEILLYSATLQNYLATPEANIIHGARSGLGQPERLLFPGVLAIAIGVIGLLTIDRRRVVVIAAGLTGFVISLGLNTPIYELLRIVIFPYRGLRAPARGSILLFLALAALVAFGWARITRDRSRKAVAIATVVMAALLLAEYRTRMDAWLTLPGQPSDVYRWLAAQPRSVVAEVPFARADSLHSISDGLYMFNSTWHWQPIVNGYSGFFPNTFLELALNTERFPDDVSIAYLKRRGVDLIVVHGSLLPPDDFGEMTASLLARTDVEAVAKFEAQGGADLVFRLRR